jgi:uncharacterized lipoprotein YmbA
MSHAMRAGVVAIMLAVLAACGSAPKEQFYTLSNGTGAERAAQPPQDYAVAVGPVYIPDVVDRPHLVLRMGGSEVRISEQVRWAEPLKEGIARAVATNLAMDLQNGRVSPRAAPAAGEADYRVIVDVQDFDSALGKAATIEVMWTVRRVKDGEVQTGRMRVRQAVANDSYDELVSAHARALADVSRSIAEMIRASRERELAAAAATGASR